ncbi:MAG: sodium:calcium antiporter [Nanoarchaeota archaeon]
MAFLADIVFFTIFALVLGKTSIWIVRSLSKISSFLRLSEFTSGFIILALATTLPELFVGINAAISKNPALSLGNVIGSNVVNLTFILAIAVLLSKGISIESKIVRQDSLYMLLTASLPVLLMLDGKITRLEGALLIVAFFIYIFKVAKDRKKFEKTANQYKKYELFNAFAVFIVSSILLLISASFLVKFAVNIARDLNVAPILIGIFLLAFGTSLPELSLAIRSSLSGHSGITLGDLIGSVIINSTLVVGVTSLISPIIANYTIFITSSFFMLITCLLVMAFIHTGNRLTVKEGAILLIVYALFTIIELSINLVK